MRNLTLGDLTLGIANLLTDRKADVLSCGAGQLFEPMLTKKNIAIVALPEALRGGKPLAEELAEVDNEHDGFGNGLYAYTDAILSVPGMGSDQQAAARRIREALIPSRAALVDSYAEEAATAKRNRAKLAERKTDLEMFPVPGNKTLYHWAEEFVNRGDRLDDLLNQRSLVGIGSSSRAAAGRLRSDTIGLLYQFRSALRAEIADKGLPAELEAKIFSYLDELSSRRPSKKSTPKEAPPEPAPTP